MIIVLTILLSFARLEQEVTRRHLENHAGEGPKVGTRAILSPYDHFWRAVLPGLDFCREVMICPTAISQITNLEFKIFTKFWSPALRPILLNLMLNLPWVQQVEF